MPIKPMDMQVLLPQVQKAAKAENQKLARQEMSLVDQKTDQDKDNKIKQHHVASMEKKDDHKLKNDSDKKSSKDHKKKKKDKSDENSEEEPVIKHGFDMKV